MPSGRLSSSEDMKHSLTTFNETAVAPFQQHRDIWRSLMAQIWQLSCAVKLFSAEVTKMRVIMMTAAIYFGEPVFATGLAIGWPRLLAVSWRLRSVSPLFFALTRFDDDKNAQDGSTNIEIKGRRFGTSFGRKRSAEPRCR